VSRTADAIAPGGPSAAPPGAFQSALTSGSFTVTAEIGPPRGADAEVIRDKVVPLRGWVAAVNITDNQSAVVRLSSWAGSLVARAAGVEPIMQLTCRDRNRIALQSELLSASAMGIPNILVMTGDHPRFGDHADAKPVFDLDSVQLLWVARTMRDEGRLLSGRVLGRPPSWFLGAVENPSAPPVGFRAARLGKKVAAGAQFVQTQYVFDVGVFAAWMQQVRDLGLHERCHILAGVGPVMSVRALTHLQHHVPGVRIPSDTARRLLAVPTTRTADEGIRVCAETIGRIREIPGVAGVHVMAVGNERRIPEILRLAGVRQAPPAAEPAAGDPAGAGQRGAGCAD
jgi:methylenetetrahydrofolate reductase (NADPH)